MPTFPDSNDEFDPFADELGPEETAEIERRMNINRLKNEASDLTDGKMTTSESGDAPSEVMEEFWKNVVAYERAPLVTMHQKLEKAEIEMPADTDLTDDELHEKLWQIIGWLAENSTVLEDTNHLSDRELYVWLRDDYFHQSDADMPGMTCHASPVGSCGDDDMQIIMRYYADEDWRKDWAEDFPEFEMPTHEEPPYDRDRLLPR